MPRLWADERAIRQICLNLLSNAIKFTPQGGEIWLKVGWTASGGQYMSVKDTGPGIPEEEIPIVLASFGQGSNSIKSAEQGAGLGLPIAKSLVDLHGGTFTLKSKLRIGTEVIVTFPPERVMAALAPLAEPAPPIAARNRDASHRKHRAGAKRQRFAGGCSGSGRELRRAADLGDCVRARRSLSCAPRPRTDDEPWPRSKAPATRSARSTRVSALCVGCGRSLAEIAGWIGIQRRRARAHHGRAAAAAGDAAADARSARRCRPEGRSRAPPALVPAGDPDRRHASCWCCGRTTTRSPSLEPVRFLVARPSRSSALVFVGGSVLALFRERFSHALEAALIWVVIALAAGWSATPTASSCATSPTACWPNSCPGRAATRGRAVEIARGQRRQFPGRRRRSTARASSMVLDTGASAVVLTQEAAKAAGLPLEVLTYSVNVDTANGRTRAAPVTLDRHRRRRHRRTRGAGADRAAGPAAHEPARHELPQPAGKLGSARRQADAARASVNREPTSLDERRPVTRQSSARSARSAPGRRAPLFRW